ncbi:DNA/RNA non-specific endonuclease [Pseudoramibacter sp. HA2172]|uniref:DNA/RNA non-specific endonuclease n=1 Tax=Pseudoramibacter faecis TaxID=3108534 RepID=UPI002E7925FB|nr:DNA/RNA non-specific endonuclease [Pseudoramibacter sp. HA2172]
MKTRTQNRPQKVAALGLLSLLLAAALILGGCALKDGTAQNPSASAKKIAANTADLAKIPAYRGDAYVAINNNEPTFADSALTTKSFETYSALDAFGRCGTATANISKATMPKAGERRGDISAVRPTGWHNAAYRFVDGKMLYNRCHLIGYQLAAENANARNLITGTRYMNVEGMLPFENLVADYVKETGNHVLYRVTPIFDGNNLVASGVQMEAKSVEDKGEGVSFNVYCYNVQPGVKIDYSTGYNTRDASQPTDAAAIKKSAGTSDQTTSQHSQNNTEISATYVLNVRAHKFHRQNCTAVSHMAEKNKQTYTGGRADLIRQGYTPCAICNP